jgi:pimeloyl-ACP methyl ester carboxylesterase
MSLYVQESGTQGAPSIVFLHGIGASGWMWQRQTAALADYHCLNPDLPGHGKSNQVEWISLADTARQVAALIEARATQGRAHVVGLSLGGHLTLEMLERHAHLLDRVVISGVTSVPMPNRALLKPQLWLTTTLFKQDWFVNMQARSLPLSPDEQAAFTKNLRAASMQAYRRIWEEVSEYAAPASLGGVQTPTLITAGSRESKIIRQAVETLSNLLPNAQGRLAPGLGHGWNVQNPRLFNATVRAWISGAPLPAELQTVHRGYSAR